MEKVFCTRTVNYDSVKCLKLLLKNVPSFIDDHHDGDHDDDDDNNDGDDDLIQYLGYIENRQ